MRRIDVIGIGLIVFLAGGLFYLIFQFAGLDQFQAGIWSQAILVGIALIWTVTYITRFLTKKMTYHQQLKDYEDAFIKKRLEEMTPEELAKLQTEIEQEEAANS
jgi:hypothetical protein